MKKLTSLFCTLLLLLAIFPLVSADNSILVQAKWVVDSQPYDDKQLAIDQYDTASFYVAVDYPGTSDDYNLNIGIYKDGTKIADPVYVSSEQSPSGTEMFILEYTPTIFGTFHVGITAYTDDAESSAELELIVACSDVDSDSVCDDDEVLGCTNPEAENYNSEATNDDGSCVLTPVIDDENHAPTMDVNPKADSITALIFPTYELKVDEEKVITVNGYDQDNDDLTFSFVSSNENDLPTGLIFTDNGDNTATIDISILNAGSYGARIAVSDGQAEHFWVLIFKVTENVNDVNNAPVMDNLDLVEVDEGEVKIITVSATDANGQDLTYNFKEVKNDNCNAPFDFMCSWNDMIENLFGYMFGAETLDYVSLNKETGEFTISPGFNFVKHPSTDKTVQFQFRAYDGFEYSEWELLTIKVNDVNQVPEVSFNGNTPFEEGKQLSITVTATDADNEDNLETTVTGLPGWATAETNEDGSISIVGSPQEGDAGEYAIIVTVTDGITIVEVGYTFTVNPTGTSGEVYGCMDPLGLNYNSEATVDDGSCEFFQETDGCTDSEALNYNIAATIDDGSCGYPAPTTNAFFNKAHFVQDSVTAGDYAYLNVKVSNNGDEDMSNLKVSAMIYDLGVKASSGKFNLNEGDNQNLGLVLPIPYGVEQGTYTVKIALSNNHFHETAYRQIEVI